MIEIHPSQLLFHAGGGALARYGVLARRLAPGTGVREVVTRNLVSYATAQGGTLVGYAANMPRAHFVTVGSERIATIRGEPTRANKTHRTYLHNGAITGWALINATNGLATLTAVTDAAELARAGLGSLVSDSYVLKLDNTLGDTAAAAFSDGSTGNTNLHALSAYVRGGTGSIRRNNTADLGGNVVVFGAQSIYTRVSGTVTPGATGTKLQIAADAGQVVYFVLAQMEEGGFVTSVIPNSTAGSITRPDEYAQWSGFPWLGGAQFEHLLYVRFIEREIPVVNGRLVALGSDQTDTNGHASIFKNSSSQRYSARFGNGSAQNIVTLSGLPIPAAGSLVELAFAVSAAQLRVVGRVGGGAASEATAGGVALGTWHTGAKLSLNTREHTPANFFGCSDFADAKVVRGAFASATAAGLLDACQRAGT